VLNSLIVDFRGELAALSAALIWAIASVVYISLGKQLPPLVLNLSKSAIAIVLILLTLGLRGDFLPDTTPAAVGLLLLSGAIGIGFGDTAFFEALNCLGVRRCLLMEALAPPLTALLALVFLGEQLTALSYLGIGLTVAGVSWVIVERAPDSEPGNFRPLRGVGFGMIAALGQAGGSVMSTLEYVSSVSGGGGGAVGLGCGAAAWQAGLSTAAIASSPGNSHPCCILQYLSGNLASANRF
jgi:drug/metabolite transporter (DMT)-like permease